jgi:cytoskeleton protein RodZ
MRVRIDGRQVREVLLEKGQTARFAADAGFVITVGNAGGVDLSLNGERIPPLGASGQVVRELPIPPVRLRPGATDSHGGEAAERPRTPAE